MWCLWSLKHSAVSISSNWSFPYPSPLLSHTLTLFFFCCFQGYSKDTRQHTCTTGIKWVLSRSYANFIISLISLETSSEGNASVTLPLSLSHDLLSCPLCVSPLVCLSLLPPATPLSFDLSVFLKSTSLPNNLTASSVPCQVRALSSLRRWIDRPSPSHPPWVPACWGTPPSTCQDSSQWVTSPWLTDHVSNPLDYFVMLFFHYMVPALLYLYSTCLWYRVLFLRSLSTTKQYPW